MSLRGRLLLATVVLVALGLLVADSATYTLLRSSLIGRVDQQLKAASQFVEIFSSRGGRGPGPGPISGGERHDGFERPQSQVFEKLDETGARVDYDAGPFGSSQSLPTLPTALPGSTSASAAPARIFTAGSVDGTIRYRVLAMSRTDAPGTLVVAFPLGDAEAALGRLLLIEAIVTLAVLGAVAALALWLVRLGLRPLTQIEHAAADIAAGDLSRRVTPSEERTEVGRLGRALNVMMEKIEAAFAERRASEARLRRFVADASHELRTPLTSIRGYAELFRRGADERPEDLSKSMRRIEEESSRMGTLVDELLLLARLDQGPQLERGPVDLTAVATDAVSDARAREPLRPIDLVSPGPVVIDGDDARLRQIASNLLSNALEHTPAGTPVHVQVSRDGADAILEVTDEGPGLAPEHAGRVFDRFFRVDEARSRDDGGSGLGLSIVAAIAQAHGGRAELLTAPGRGARFIVTLPVSAPS